MSDNYTISDDKTKLQIDEIKKLMEQTYWAKKRSKEICEKTIEHSACYGVYDENDLQIGFARVITDYVTTFYLCDVIIDKDHRGKRLGKRLVTHIIEDEMYKDLYGLLVTSNAHRFYEPLGFKRDSRIFMHKPVNKRRILHESANK
ncbi:MAG: GNAT family N-acetyltransferase [Acetobacterium sp.]